METIYFHVSFICHSVFNCRNTLMTTTLAIVYLAHVIGLSWYWRPKKALELDQE